MANPNKEAGPEARGRSSRFWRSIFHDPVSSHSGLAREWTVFETLALHVHPRQVPRRALDLKLTWGLGGMPLVLFAMLALTGIMLIFAYEPSPELAYASLEHIQENVLFGQWVRNIHYWSGHTLVLVTFLHMLRVFFTGAFHSPRQFNWVLGWGLFLCVLFSDFTGYLLPWDQLAYWAVTISTNMLEYVPFVGNWIQQVLRGGSVIGPATLSNFYALHIACLPLAACFMMAFHFWRVRKAGGVAVPAPEGSERPSWLPTVPHLVVREAAVGLVLIATILLVSVFFDAPLEAPANAGMSPNPAKAPWFFTGVQEVFLHVHPFFAIVVFPGMLIGALVLLPYFMDGKESRPGIWFQTDRGRRMCAAAGGVSVLVVILGVLADELMQKNAVVGAARSSWLMGGLVPAVVILGFAWGVYVFTKKKYGATHGEAMQALFTFFLAAVVVLTVIGIWFRGEFMALCWPWENGVL